MPITHRVARYVVESKIGEPKSLSRPSPQLVAVLDLVVHIPRFYNLLISVDDYDDDNDEEYEPDLVDELKRVFDSAMSCGLETEINIRKVFEKLSELTGRNYISEYYSPEQILRDLADQMTKCLPSLVDIFCSKSEEASIDWLGSEMSSRQGLPMSVAVFNDETQTLEASFRDRYSFNFRAYAHTMAWKI